MLSNFNIVVHAPGDELRSIRSDRPPTPRVITDVSSYAFTIPQYITLNPSKCVYFESIKCKSVQEMSLKFLSVNAILDFRSDPLPGQALPARRILRQTALG